MRTDDFFAVVQFTEKRFPPTRMPPQLLRLAGSSYSFKSWVAPQLVEYRIFDCFDGPRFIHFPI